MSVAEDVLQRAEFLSQMLGQGIERYDTISNLLADRHAGWRYRLAHEAGPRGERVRVWTFEDGSALRLTSAVQLVEAPR